MSGRNWQFVIGISLASWATVGCRYSDAPIPAAPVSVIQQEPLSPTAIARVEAFCGNCHALPVPESFPKDRWPKEVEQGYGFYAASLRTDLNPPSQHEALRYFQERAPEKLTIGRAKDIPSEKSPIRFDLGNPVEIVGIKSPALSHIRWDESLGTLLTSDMKSGEIRNWKFAPTGCTSQVVARGKNSCRLTPVDWNGDEYPDYFLGELGSFLPEDHELGRVSLLVGNPEGFHHEVLAQGLGRVVEVQALDYEEDGDLDLLVAEFGWRTTGSLLLLRNSGGNVESPQFKKEILDPRHGALGVQVADLNGDKKPDFVAAFGQEFESVEAFINRGAGQYEKQTLLHLPDPSAGSSCFQIVDLDGDGKLDILHANGDTMDSFLAKPYHGLRWLQNVGAGRFAIREIAQLVGVQDAAAADLDGDGDLDIAAVVVFAGAEDSPPGTFDSVVWFEQRPDAIFVRHSIERDRCTHCAFAIVDLDGDMRLDLVVGDWSIRGPAAPPFTIYLNRPAP